MKKWIVVALCVVAASASATMFVVPDDDELIAKSTAIVSGHVLAARVRDGERGLETVYQVRVERALKGEAAAIIEVVSPGGAIEGRSTAVAGVAHLQPGEHVLLFLIRHHGDWTTTDLAIGKFAYRQGAGGTTLLVRDGAEIVGIDRRGQPAREKIRRANDFVHFIEAEVAGESGAKDYFARAGEIPARTERDGGAGGSYPAESYATRTTFNGQDYPNRWVFDSTKSFRRSTRQNATGLPDGGEMAIRTAIHSWLFDCSSLFMKYDNADAGRNPADGNNIFLFNDPDGDVPGSWNGSGPIALTFVSGTSLHTFNGSPNGWIAISDADTIFQDGYGGAQPTLQQAVIHSLGHALGIRDSDLDPAGGACDFVFEECTAAAVMQSAITGNFTDLQPWDKAAADALYPPLDANCRQQCVAPQFVTQPADVTIEEGETTELGATVDPASKFLFYELTPTGRDVLIVNEEFNLMQPSATSLSRTVRPSVTSRYWIRIVRTECGFEDSRVATVTVVPPSPPPCNPTVIILNPPTQTIVLGNTATLSVAATGTGLTYQWFGPAGEMAGATSNSIEVAPAVFSQYFVRLTNSCGAVLNSDPAQIAVQPVSITGWFADPDFNGDAKTDQLIRNEVTGDVGVWLLDGTTQTGGGFAGRPGLAWRLAGWGDLNGDHKTDIVIQYQDTGLVGVWLMDSTSIIGAGQIASPGRSVVVLGTADLNGDGKADIIYRNSGNGDVGAWIMNGVAVTSSGVFATPGTSWSIAAAGRFDAGLTDDLLIRHDTNGDVGVWLMAGLGITSGTVVGSPGLNFGIAGAADLDGNGRSDIVMQNLTNGDVGGWLMNGVSFVSGGVFASPGLSWRPVSVGDFNLDGIDDLVVHNASTGEIGAWLMNGLTVTSGVRYGWPPPVWVPAGSRLTP